MFLIPQGNIMADFTVSAPQCLANVPLALIIGAIRLPSGRGVGVIAVKDQPKKSGKQPTGFGFFSHLIAEGDILLCTDPDSRISNAIKKVAGGDFSHGAICTIPPLFIESDVPAVREFSLERMSIKSPANVRILRLKWTVPDSLELARKAASIALDYHGNDYSVIAAISTMVPFLDTKLRSKAFCSYLVAAAYLKAGLNITASGKDPEKTTPYDLQESPYFDDVTDGILMPVKFRPEWGMPHWLDGPRSQAPAELQASALSIMRTRISDFLIAQGQPACNSYLDAQVRYIKSRDELWFAELDKCYADWLEEFVTPTLDLSEELVTKARERNAQTLKDRLDSCDYPSLLLSLQFVENRIKTTERLLLERARSLHAIGGVYTKFAFKAAGVMLEHDARVYAALRHNLRNLRSEKVEHVSRLRMLNP